MVVEVRNSKGFTFVEMLLVLAVGGMLLSGAVTAIYQTTRIAARSSTQLTALDCISRVAYWVNKDVKTAANTTLADGGNWSSSLVLNWTTYYDSTGSLTPDNPWYHRCEYTLSSGNVTRVYKRNNFCPPTTVNSTAAVGRNISAIQFSRQGSLITMSVTSSPQGKVETSENKTYKFYLQPKEEGLVQP